MKQDSLKSSSKTDWNRLNNMSDDDIDYSDIPELKDNWFKNAKLRMPESIIIKFDSDILDWLKTNGEKHQKQINIILRDYIKAHA